MYENVVSINCGYIGSIIYHFSHIKTGNFIKMIKIGGEVRKSEKKRKHMNIAAII